MIDRKLYPVTGLLLALTAALATALVASWWWLHPAQAAPDVELLHIDGQRSRLASLQGTPTLLNFWATDCDVCLAEQPAWVALYEELAPRGLDLVGVAMPYDPPNRVLEWAESRALPYPVALDLDGAVALAFGPVRVTPTTVLIDAEGRIRWTRLGRLDMTELREELLALL